MSKETAFKDIIQAYQEYSDKIQWNNEPKELYEPFNYIMHQKGKKLRPVSLLISFQLFDKNISKAFVAAYAIELFHNFTLVHDDIMDKADSRRGLATVHELFGNDKAILSGDAMLLESCKLILKATDNDVACISSFVQMAIEVCQGQSMDMQFEQQEIISIDEYLRMIRLKTSVLLGHSMSLGARIAGQDEEIQFQLNQLGIELGIAFQIQDDYLDLFGEMSTFGKKKGGDLIQRKKTILILLAIDDLSDNEKLLQLKHYNSALNEQAQIEYYTQFFEAKKVSFKLKELYQSYYSSSMNRIENLNIPSIGKQDLRNFVDLILERNH